VHLLGLPFDPLKSPTFFKISKLSFIGLDNKPVEMSYSYSEMDKMLHNNFSFQKNNEKSVLNFTSKKPTNLALVMVEDQKLSFYGEFHHFNSLELESTFGGNWERINDLDGTFTGVVIYAPTDLITGDFNNVNFEKVDVDVTLSGKPVKFKGDFSVTREGVKKSENFKVGENELGFMNLVDHIFHN